MSSPQQPAAPTAEALLMRRLEWSGLRYCGAGDPMGMRLGTDDPACPICRGIKPDGPWCSGWIKEAIGHRQDCELAAYLALIETAPAEPSIPDSEFPIGPGSDNYGEGWLSAPTKTPDFAPEQVKEIQEAAKKFPVPPLREQVEKLKGALRQAEWCVVCFDGLDSSCPICHKLKSTGKHDNGCPIGSALSPSPPAGEQGQAKQEPWRCSQCNRWNPQFRDICSGCGTTHAPPAQPESPAPTDADPPARVCPTCGGSMLQWRHPHNPDAEVVWRCTTIECHTICDLSFKFAAAQRGNGGGK